ncbi:hypothetical protein ACFQ51_53020 [Streptomyces kaempferi]
MSTRTSPRSSSASALSIPRLTIQRIESGATDARIGWLLRIAHDLDVPASNFLEE